MFEEAVLATCPIRPLGKWAVAEFFFEVADKLGEVQEMPDEPGCDESGPGFFLVVDPKNRLGWQAW